MKHWRRNRGIDNFTLPTSDQNASFESSRPMDIQEQEALVRSLEKEQAQQAYFWRRVFAVILLCYGAFLVWSIFQQGSSPWELRYHAYFMEEMSSLTLITAYWVAVVACTMAIIGMLRCSEKSRQWLKGSVMVGFVLAVFWLVYMRRLPRFRWDVVWLPFGPVSAAAICLYIDHLLTESSEEVRKLRSYMYAFKAI